MNLYELTAQYNELIEFAFNASDDGSIDEHMAEMLGELEGDIDHKLGSLCRVIVSLTVSAQGIADEVARLGRKRSSALNAVDRIKQYIKDNLDALGEKKRKVDELFTVSVQPNPPSLKVNAVDMVPTEYDMPQERQINTVLIKDAFKRGVQVPGCEIVRGTHLRIR